MKPQNTPFIANYGPSTNSMIGLKKIFNISKDREMLEKEKLI